MGRAALVAGIWALALVVSTNEAHAVIAGQLEGVRLTGAASEGQDRASKGGTGGSRSGGTRGSRDGSSKGDGSTTDRTEDEGHAPPPSPQGSTAGGPPVSSGPQGSTGGIPPVSSATQQPPATDGPRVAVIIVPPPAEPSAPPAARAPVGVVRLPSTSTVADGGR